MTIQSVAFNGVPVEDYGYNCHDVGEWLTLPQTTFAKVKVQGQPGEVSINTPPQLASAVRPIELSDTTSTTILARRTKLRTLIAALGGQVEVTWADDPNAISFCTVQGGRGQGITPLTMLQPDIYFALSLLADDPYVYQASPSTYVLRASTRETVPLGTAACKGLVYVNGGGAGSGAVGIRLRHQSGEVLQEITLDNAATIALLGALTFAAADTMLFDCQNPSDGILHYVAASNTWVSRLAYMNDGQDFPKFDPLDAPTLEILNGADPAKIPRYLAYMVKMPLYQEWIRAAEERDSAMDQKQRAWLAARKGKR